MAFVKGLLCVSLLGTSFTLPNAFAAKATNDLWTKFEAVQQGSAPLHQQFDVTRRVRSGYVDQVIRLQLNVDFSQGKWREQPVGADGEHISVFDGQNVFMFESGGTEYTRPKQSFEKEKPLPEPYDTKVDWGKVKEVQQLPCGFSGKDHPCVIVEAPIKPWLRPGLPGEVIRMTNGTIRIMADTETGIWLRVHISASVERNGREAQWELTYNINQMSLGAPVDASLFNLPNGLKEVDQLSRWDEARFKKELIGKPAPNLEAKDIHGTPISLAAMKGKTVLLDFWTTWCPPCQSDAPSIEQLNRKYGSSNLAIVGVSVDEDRETVENYLKKHPHSYSVVLSSENHLPAPYQVGSFPTYLIVSPDGTLMTIEEGDKGFGKLRKDLEKAGMNTE